MDKGLPEGVTVKLTWSGPAGPATWVTVVVTVDVEDWVTVVDTVDVEIEGVVTVCVVVAVVVVVPKATVWFTVEVETLVSLAPWTVCVTIVGGLATNCVEVDVTVRNRTEDEPEPWSFSTGGMYPIANIPETATRTTMTATRTYNPRGRPPSSYSPPS